MKRTEALRQRLFSTLRTLTADVEELVKAAPEQADDTLSSLLGRVRRSLQSVRERFGQKDDLVKEARRGTDAALSYAQSRPWTTLGIVTGAAMAVGLVLWSRCVHKEEF